MKKGKIKKLISHRGYGFIKRFISEGLDDDEEGDLFFHRSQLIEEIKFDDLSEGDIVEFEIEETRERTSSN